VGTWDPAPGPSGGQGSFGMTWQRGLMWVQQKSGLGRQSESGSKKAGHRLQGSFLMVVVMAGDGYAGPAPTDEGDTRNASVNSEKGDGAISENQLAPQSHGTFFLW